MKDMDFETQLRSIASGMEYPPTPDIAGSMARLHTSPRPRLMNRTLTRSLILAAVLLASLLLIPPVRAAVLEFIQIGVVRIFRSEPAPAPAPTQIPLTVSPFTATPAPTLPSLLPLLEQIAGETTLAEAQQKTEYHILLPTYPAGIGEPDRVFVQDADGPMTILVWLDSRQPDQVKMSLHFIPEGSWAVDKFAPQGIDETSVNSQPAVWAVGPYLLLMRNGDMKIERLVNGHVLIWEDGGVTYRLETDASMEEAVRIAESLKPVP
jgi:hypothetical protein